MAFNLRLSEKQYNKLLSILNKASNQYNPQWASIAQDLRDFVYREHEAQFKKNS